ncbi:MAG: phosphotransferase, partial [Burkholderiaceae bacterium]
MAVFTSVDSNDAAALCAELALGPVRSLEGIAGGIENTNYFLTTGSDEQPRAWVLTLFERLSAEQLPFYLQLMHHLAEQGL